MSGLLTDVIEGIGSAATFAVTRAAAPSMAGGIYAAGSTSALSVRAVEWPLKGRELLRLLNGRTGIELRQLVTTSAILIPENAASGGAGGDKVTIGGFEFEVENSEKWEAFGETFYVATCRRKL